MKPEYQFFTYQDLAHFIKELGADAVAADLALYYPDELGQLIAAVERRKNKKQKAVLLVRAS